jgi:Transposase
LAVRTSKSATCELLRVAWRTIGAIVTRVNNDIEERIDRLDGLRRIGIDEISYKRSHRYLIVVVDHDTGHLVWAGPGRNDTSLEVFFNELGDERCALLTHVSADMADWIARVVAKRAPNAVRGSEPPCTESCSASARSSMVRGWPGLHGCTSESQRDLHGCRLNVWTASSERPITSRPGSAPQEHAADAEPPP